MASIASIAKGAYGAAAEVLNYGSQEGSGIFTKYFKGGESLFQHLDVGQNVGVLVGGAVGGAAGVYRHRDEGFWGAAKAGVVGAGLGSAIGQHLGGTAAGVKALRGLGRNASGELASIGDGVNKLGAWDFTKTLVGSEASFDLIRNVGRAKAAAERLPINRFGSALNTRLTERYGRGLGAYSLRALQMMGASTAIGAAAGGVYGAYHDNTWGGVKAGALAGASLGVGIVGRKGVNRLRTSGILETVKADMRV